MLSKRRDFRAGGILALVGGLAAGCGLVGGGTSSSLPTRSGDAQVATAFAQGVPKVAVDVFGAAKPQLQALVNAGMDVWADSPDRVRGTIPAKAWSLVQQFGLDVVKLQSIHALNHYDPQYLTVEQMAAEMHTLAAQYPSLCKVVMLGKSYEDRPIWSLEVGTGNTAAKPGVAFTGGTHSRELVPPEVVIRIARWLLEGYGKDPDATFAVDNRDTWVTPMVNPDGHVRAEKGLDWRKNADPGWGGDPDSFGVDLNRNYDDRNWGSTGTDTDPNGETFGGPKPFSEPETRAMAGLYQSRKFTVLMTWHSFSNSVMWPWNDDNQPPADPRMPAIGAKLGQLSGYPAYQGDQLYDTSGDETDFAYGKLGVLAYTVEVGDWNDGFDPPYSSMDRFWKQNFPMAAYLEAIAGNPAITSVN